MLLGPASGSQPSGMPGKLSLIMLYILHVRPTHQRCPSWFSPCQNQDQLRPITAGTGRATLSALGQGEMDGKCCCNLAKSSWLKGIPCSRNTDGIQRLIAKSDSSLRHLRCFTVELVKEGICFIYAAVKKLC